MLKEHEIPANQVTLPFDAKYPTTIVAKVDWPTKIRHNDKNFFISNSHGIHNKTELPSCRYSLETDPHVFVWLLVTGEVVPD